VLLELGCYLVLPYTKLNSIILSSGDTDNFHTCHFVDQNSDVKCVYVFPKVNWVELASCSTCT
jgi:hypothetical protein